MPKFSLYLDQLNSLTNYLPYSIVNVFLEKLTVAHLVKAFPLAHLF